MSFLFTITSSCVLSETVLSSGFAVTLRPPVNQALILNPLVIALQRGSGKLANLFDI